MHLISWNLISVLLLIVNCSQLWAQVIVDYRQGANGRAEMVHAVITAKDLHTGQSTKTNRYLAKKIRAMGVPGDNCGHIVAAVLGGPMQAYNLFPQNEDINSNDFINNVEGHMQKFLEQDIKDGTNERKIDYKAELTYKDDLATRPDSLRFEIKFFRNYKLVPYTAIPATRKHHVPSNPYTGIVSNAKKYPDAA